MVGPTSGYINSGGVDFNPSKDKRETRCGGTASRRRVVDIDTDSRWEDGAWISYESLDKLKSQCRIGERGEGAW